MCFPPLSEGSRIDLDNRTLHQGLRPHQLIITGIVDDIDDAGLPGCHFTTPRKVTRIESKTSFLDISTTNTDFVNAFGANTGVGRLPTQFELSLLAVVSPFCTGMRAFMTRIATYAYIRKIELMIRIDLNGWID